MAKEKIKMIASGIRGVLMVITEPLDELKMRFSTQKKFYNFTMEHRRTEKRMNGLKEKQQIIKDKLVKIVMANPGLRGLQTVSDNLRTSISQKTKSAVAYSREPLKESLGEIYDGIVKEDLQFTIILTPEFNKDALTAYLKSFFQNEETYDKAVGTEIILRVDENKLAQLEMEDKVQLKEGAVIRDEETTWQVKTTSVKSK